MDQASGTEYGRRHSSSPGRMTMIDLDSEIASDVDSGSVDLGLAQLTAPELAREIAKLRRYLVNHEDYLEAACLALLLGKHLYLYGAAGTANRQAVRLVADTPGHCPPFATPGNTQRP